MATTEPSLIRRLFEAAGYRLDDREVGLRAVRPRDGRAVILVTARRSPVELESEFPPDTLHRTIVYDEDPGDVARKLASERGIEVLDPSSLGPALGELLLLPGAAEPVPEGSHPPPVETPPGLFPEGERVVGPRLGRAEAEALAGVEGFRFTLRLVPFFVAPYRVRVASAHGGAGAVSDHLVAVNALSGRSEVWEVGDRELVADLEGAHQRLE
ncbi:MAG: hypothetical protein L3K09_02265, partial [Thermoplasmata archaeon]|nr:hypothetical protein [Thermoplasmata archaeon]